MARKVRLEYEGAVYHVINRGNYRSWIFESEGARSAFEGCLFEACEKSNWILHAFVVMGNHYHLAIETPQANLVAGMTWLQGTFAARFNRLRGENGHLFQGRYKALIVQDGEWLGNLCHYIHLNPVRAGLVDAKGLRDYRFSSYWYLWQRRSRPPFLDVRAYLDCAGGLKDNPPGRRSYEEYLELMMAEDRARKKACFDRMSRGWALGGKEFKKDLVKEHRERLARIDLGEDDAGELRELLWEEVLEACLRKVGKSAQEAAVDRKSAPWKIAIAAVLKGKTQASNTWIAGKLQMGVAKNVSYYVGLLRDGKVEGSDAYEQILRKTET
jgi:putative transposase